MKKSASYSISKEPHWLRVLLDNLGWVLFAHSPPFLSALGWNWLPVSKVLSQTNA